MAAGSKGTRVLVAVVFIASVAVIAASIIVIKQSNRITKVERRISSGSVEQVAILADREARNAHLSLATDDKSARVDGVVMPNGSGFLLGGNLKEASSGSIYQLWATTPAGSVSLGLLGDDATRAAAFRVPDGASRLFITIEASSGAVTPAAVTIASGAIPTLP